MDETPDWLNTIVIIAVIAALMWAIPAGCSAIENADKHPTVWRAKVTEKQMVSENHQAVYAKFSGLYIPLGGDSEIQYIVLFDNGEQANDQQLYAKASKGDIVEGTIGFTYKHYRIIK